MAAGHARLWHKLHLATDADTGEIVAAELTGHDVDDDCRVERFLGHHAGPNRVTHR